LLSLGKAQHDLLLSTIAPAGIQQEEYDQSETKHKTCIENKLDEPHSGFAAAFLLIKGCCTQVDSFNLKNNVGVLAFKVSKPLTLQLRLTRLLLNRHKTLSLQLE